MIGTLGPWLGEGSLIWGGVPDLGRGLLVQRRVHHWDPGSLVGGGVLVLGRGL